MSEENEKKERNLNYIYVTEKKQCSARADDGKRCARKAYAWYDVRVDGRILFRGPICEQCQAARQRDWGKASDEAVYSYLSREKERRDGQQSAKVRSSVDAGRGRRITVQEEGGR